MGEGHLKCIDYIPFSSLVTQQRVSACLGAGGGRTFRVPAEPKQVILDGDMLLDECHESYPGDVYGSNLRSKNINGVAAEDAPFFISLASLDLSDNAVMFEHTAPFPALRQLVLNRHELVKILKYHVVRPQGKAGCLLVRKRCLSSL